MDGIINLHPDPQGEREKFVNAFNDTMLKIWQEQITLLADNIGQSFIGVVAQALDDNYRRYNH